MTKINAAQSHTLLFHIKLEFYLEEDKAPSSVCIDKLMLIIIFNN